MIKVVDLKRNSVEEVYNHLLGDIAMIEQHGGMKEYAITATLNNGDVFTSTSEPESYASLLGAIEHLKLKFFKENNR